MALQLDREGFLRNIGDWDEGVARRLAESEQITLTDEHWEILRLVRQYYKRYRLFPANRVLVAKIREVYGAEKGSSMHLMTLFTGKPARVIAKIAGLPKPPNCD